jgi:radical SAM protein with 4Fe4S-binding SPASM domain
MRQRLERLGVEYRLHRIIPGSCEATVCFQGRMGVFMVGRNYYTKRYRVNRGGTVDVGGERPPRTSPCFSLFHTLDVEYNGRVMPCCNLLSDHRLHGRYCLGTITGEVGSLFAAYFSREAARWRKSMMNFQPKRPPCDQCHYLTVEDTAAMRELVDYWGRQATLDGEGCAGVIGDGGQLPENECGQGGMSL